MYKSTNKNIFTKALFNGLLVSTEIRCVCVGPVNVHTPGLEILYLKIRNGNIGYIKTVFMITVL